MKSGIFLRLTLLMCLSRSLFAVIIPISDQPGYNIVCTGPTFTYQYDVRQHGVDTNLAIWGDAGFVEEDNYPDAAASFYTDSSKGGTPAYFQYSFVAETGTVFGDVSVSSLARIFSNACSVTGEYKIGDGSWVQFLLLTSSGTAQPVDVFENIHDSHFSVRYTVSWINTPYSEHVQLFRSWGPEPGQPGSFAFTFSASLVSDADCHKANLIGDTVWIDVADFAVMAADYGLSGSGLAGDLDGSGSCDLADLQWLADYWLCDCYD